MILSNVKTDISEDESFIGAKSNREIPQMVVNRNIYTSLIKVVHRPLRD